MAKTRGFTLLRLILIIGILMIRVGLGFRLQGLGLLSASGCIEGLGFR